MLFNSCAYWNEIREAVFKKQQFITVCYSTCVCIEMKQEGQFSKKQQFITVCYSTCVRIEMKQERQFSKKSNWWQYATELMCNMKGKFSKKIKTIYYSMLFNLCGAYWNETIGTFFKKNNKKNILLQFAIQLVRVLKWNKRGSFQKTTKKTIYSSMLFNLCAYWNETRGTVFKKTTIYYSMLFNLCAYWNETRKAVFKKIQLMTICYWTHVRHKGEVFKENQNNLLQYAFQLVWCILKWNNRDCFQKKQQKKQFITVCYSTCESIEMKQEGQFSKNNKKNNLL